MPRKDVASKTGRWVSIQIVLVESDQNEGERLSHALQSSVVQLHWIDDPARLQGTLQTALPDLLLIGWCGSSRALCDLLRNLRASTHARDVPIIVQSPYADTHAKIEALDSGADDYVVTPCDTGELRAHIRALLRRVPRARDAMPQINGLLLDPHTQKVTAQTAVGPRNISLSPQEFRLLHFLVQHPQRVHTREQLLDRVWGHVFVGERTVDVHVRKLRAALAGTMCEDSIQTIRGAGYRLGVAAETTQTAPPTQAKNPPEQVCP
jgi:two-component system phosphate regulon response regulator PhoB